MSANIKIAEGQIARAFGPVAKLKTAKSGGGSVLWVPRADVALGTKNIAENGLYLPSADGKYGFSRVAVSVSDSGSVTGKGQDGNEYFVTKYEGGDLSEEKLPSSIRVTTNPTVLDYVSGDRINYSGMVVTAYYGDGNVYGRVPLNELILPKRFAEYDENNAHGEATSDLETNWEQPIRFYRRIDHFYDYHGLDGTYGQIYTTYVPLNGAVMLIKQATLRKIEAIFVSREDGYLGRMVQRWFRSWVDNGNWHTDETSYLWEVGYEINDLPVYYTAGGESFDSHAVSCEPTIQDTGSRPDQNTMWTVLYGNVVLSSENEIPVQWPRPGDGKVLETSFKITVTAVSGGGGQAGENGTGRND